MAFTPIAVTGTWLDPTGGFCSGTVTFELSTAMQDSADKQIVPAAPIVATLNASGHISQTLYATNDSTTLPLGVTYSVTENIFGSNGDAAFERTYSVVISHSAGGATVDLSSLAP